MIKLAQLLCKVVRRLTVMAPRKYRLPLYYRLAARDGGLEPELIHIDKIAQSFGVAIDVGANEGLYTYGMSRLFQKVISFEINPNMTLDLKAYDNPNVRLINSGLSSVSRSGTLYIPVLKGVPLTGWASLAPGNCPETNDHIEQHVQVSTLDAYGLHEVSFIKIDVEGHEYEVLVGGEQTILASRPILLIEVKENNIARVEGLLGRWDYRRRSLQELIGIQGSSENWIFLPSELGV